MHRFRRVLPIAAAIAAVLAVCGLIYTSIRRTSELVETGEARMEAEKALIQLIELRPESLNERDFLGRFAQLAEHPRLASAWLFDINGLLVAGAGSTYAEGSAEDLSSAEMRSTLDSLPVNLLSAHQRGGLLVASAVRREGAHNDVFGQLVRQVVDPDDTHVGFVAVAYDRSSFIGDPGVGWIVAVLMTIIALVTYWVTLPLWVFLDARSRSERAVAWGLFVFFGNLIALLGYVLSRESNTSRATTGKLT